ncbi:MAG: hypothetical protein CMN78_01150 [Spirochaetales bacterium]|nr:hypothetical protein [Spirochaetales bacterium]
MVGILFDAGDTLARPKSGHWFIPPRFWEILSRHGTVSPSRESLLTALKDAMPFLDANHSIQTEKEEFGQFIEYYDIVLRTLSISDATSKIAQDLSHDMVYNDDKFVFFSDTLDSIERLFQKGYRLGILSNTWPSLRRVFANAGLLSYFEIFVVSAEVGCYKPAAQIYRHAVEQIELPVEDIIFIDDLVANLQPAGAMGIRTILISRYGPCTRDGIECVNDLEELIKLV